MMLCQKMEINRKSALFFLFIINFYFPQLKGVFVLNENTRFPISSIVIKDEKGLFQNVSDEDGFVNFRDFNFDNQKIYVSGIGYEKEEFDLKTIKTENHFGYIFLNPKMVTIAEVQIKHSGKRSIFQTISDLDIHLRPINNSQEILRSVPGDRKSTRLNSSHNRESRMPSSA